MRNFPMSLLRLEIPGKNKLQKNPDTGILLFPYFSPTMYHPIIMYLKYYIIDAHPRFPSLFSSGSF